MDISVICPLFNEEDYVGQLIKFFLNASPEDKELILIDGDSSDGTRRIVLEYQKSHSNIKLISNPHRYVPHGLNLAIPVCSANTIVRIDAHTVYEEDYFLNVIKTFESTSADIVGGAQRVAYRNDFQQAAGEAICSLFGMGHGHIHQLDYKGYSEGVYCGSWKKKIFKKTGPFDEDLIRNQDDEFHYRALSHGFKIYQDPSIKAYYFPRSNLVKLIKQYYQYGLFRPLVIRKTIKKIKQQVKKKRQRIQRKK